MIAHLAIATLYNFKIKVIEWQTSKFIYKTKIKCSFLDYDAPVSEGGNLNKKKYHLFKDMIHRNTNLGYILILL